MKLLTTIELAEYLQVHPETIRRMVKRGQIPVVKLSEREYRFDFEKVMETLENKGR